jgi:carboxylesterase type B
MEGTLFEISNVRNPLNLSQQYYTNFLQANFGNLTTYIEQMYPISAFNSTPMPVFEVVAEIYSLVAYICPARRALRATIQHGVPGWTYRFRHQPTCGWASGISSQQVLDILGATHTSEIPFVFSHLTGLPPPNGSCSFDVDEQRISRALVSAWTSMASHGNPDGAVGITGGPWPQFDVTNSRGLLITNSTAVGVVNYTQCDFWDQVNAGIVAPWGGASGVGNETDSPNATMTPSSIPSQRTGGVAAMSASLGLAVLAATRNLVHL